MDWLSRMLETRLFALGGEPVTPADLLGALAILVLAYLASWLARRAIGRIERQRDPESRAAFYAVGRIVHYVILVSAVVVALSVAGLDLSQFTLFMSALGVGLGFGMQSVIANFLSGLIILFERHLKVGDFVELESGVTGEVREIRMRATRITTNENIDVLVPNSELTTGRVINWTLDEVSRRLHVRFGVSYGTDKARVRDVVLEAARALPFTRTDSDRLMPQVWLTGFGASSLDFELVVWLAPDAVKRPRSINAAYTWAIDDALRAAGIEIPFPQHDVRVRSLFGLEGEAARTLAFGAHAGDAAPEAPAPSGGRNDALADAQRELAAPRATAPGPAPEKPPPRA
jgi:small-conductance mechanosensitive channel